MHTAHGSVTGDGSKRGTTSPIWQYFGFRPNENGAPRDTSEEVCKICVNVIRAKDGHCQPQNVRQAESTADQHTDRPSGRQARGLNEAQSGRV